MSLAAQRLPQRRPLLHRVDHGEQRVEQRERNQHEQRVEQRERNQHEHRDDLDRHRASTHGGRAHGEHPRHGRTAGCDELGAAEAEGPGAAAGGLPGVRVEVAQLGPHLTVHPVGAQLGPGGDHGRERDGGSEEQAHDEAGEEQRQGVQPSSGQLCAVDF